MTDRLIVKALLQLQVLSRNYLKLSRAGFKVLSSLGTLIYSYTNAIENQVLTCRRYVKNAQNGRRIPGFPTERTKIFCRNGADLVCAGTLTITPAHLQYGLDIPEAVDFLVSRIG